jgi:formate dehydrogenase alpha subunit
VKLLGVTLERIFMTTAAPSTVRPVWADATVRTTCAYCGVGCQMTLNVKDNLIYRVDAPFEAVPNHGNLCVKGRFGHDYLWHPDRLTTPLIRRGGRLEPATWDEALDLVAERFAAIKAESGPDALAFLCSARCTCEENYLMQKLARQVIGTHNIDHCARLCHASTVSGLVQAFGSGAMTNSIADITAAKAILAIGTNTTEQHPVISLQIKKAVRQFGAQLVVADPRRIELTQFAVLHLQHRPGTDLALLNGLAHVILKENLHNTAFIAERTENFEAWQAVVEEYPPERASEITGVPAEDIIRAARIYGGNRPASIFYAMGITQHTVGHQNVLAIANLALLTGNLGIPGGGVNPLRGQNNVQGACDMGGLPNVYTGYQRVDDEAVRQKHAAYYGVEQPPARPGLTVTEIIRAAGAGQVRALYVMGENPAMSDPDSHHVRECLEKTDFLVVQDIFLNETGELADVVLPSAAFAEKEGTFVNTERRVQRVRKALDAPGDARPDWEILCEIAQRLGARGWDYADPEAIMQEIAEITPSFAGISYARLENGGIQWPCPNPDHPGTPILHTAKFPRGLGRFNPVHHQPAAELPDDEYPIMLTTGRILEMYHTGTMTRRVSGLNFLAPEERVEVNPQDAARLGITTGDWIRVSSRRGSVTARAWVVERVLPGLIFMTFHFAEALGNILTNGEAIDPIAKIPEFKVCAVKVEKVPAPNGH